MRGIVMVLAVVAVVSIAAESRLSGQGNAQSTSLTVTANVVKNCTITTAPVAFGNYDSVTANATTALDGIGTITVACTKGAEAKLGLDPGANAQGTTRRMTQGAAEYLTYELYKDSARTTIWGTEANGLDTGPAPNRNPRNFPVYGRVAQAQDATVGSYTDTVLATVNF